MIDIVVFAEDRRGYEAATLIADRCFCRDVPLKETELDSKRRWLGKDDEPYIKWTTLAQRWKRVRRNRKRLLHGRYGGKGSKGEYLQARKALLLATELAPSAAVVLLIRDTDGFSRHDDFARACAESHEFRTAIAAVPNPEVEAWYIAGFTPSSLDERKALTETRTELGFDPVGGSDRLSSRRETDVHGTRIKKSAKNVLARLTNSDAEREQRCLMETPLETLNERGTNNGLSRYFESLTLFAEVVRSAD